MVHDRSPQTFGCLMTLQTYGINLNPKGCSFGCFFFFFFRWITILTEWLWTNSSSLWPTLDFISLSSVGVSRSRTECCSGGRSALKPTLSNTFHLSISLELVAGIRSSNILGVIMLYLGLRNRAFVCGLGLISSLRILASVYWGQLYTLEHVVPHYVPYQNK